jgi:LysM repeat protein
LVVVLLVPVGCGTTSQAETAAAGSSGSETDTVQVKGGATRGVSSLPATASDTTTNYTVQSGDTLYSLARRHGTTVAAIVQANNLPDPNNIRIGQELIIPTVGTGSPPTASGTTTYHIVQPCDTLYSLARRYGTTVEAIVQTNNLSDPNCIRVGQSLIIPPSGPVPSELVAPSNLGATAVSQSQIDLSWKDNSGNEDGFKIERSPNGTSSWIQIATIGTGAGVGGVISYYDTGLVDCGTYYYRVRAYNAGGDSSYSNTVNAMIACPPAAPSDLGATAVSQSQIDLSWKDNSGNEDGFKIELSPNGTSSWIQIATVGANVTSYSNTGLNCGMTYYYRVRAYNAGGDSGYSNTANATTFACASSAPAAPSDLGATVASQIQINLS